MSLIDDATVEEEEGITGRKTALLYKIFVFNENSGMNIDKPDDASSI